MRSLSDFMSSGKARHSGKCSSGKCGSLRNLGILRFWKRAGRYRLDGSFTVEASLVMPLVLFAIFGIITFSLWQRDMTVVQAKMIESVCSARSLSVEQGKTVLEDGVRKTLYSSFSADEIQKGSGNVSVSTEGQPYGIYEGLDFHFSGTVRRKDYNPVSFLRACGLAQSLINR